jgi:hypothetical protein
MVFNATFNNFSVISWQSGLMAEETGVPGENHRSVTGNWQILSQNVYRVHLVMSRIQTPNFSGDIAIKHKKKFVHICIVIICVNQIDVSVYNHE